MHVFPTCEMFSHFSTGTPSADNPAPQRGGPSLLERLSAQTSGSITAPATVSKVQYPF